MWKPELRQDVEENSTWNRRYIVLVSMGNKRKDLRAGIPKNRVLVLYRGIYCLLQTRAETSHFITCDKNVENPWVSVYKRGDIVL